MATLVCVPILVDAAEAALADARAAHAHGADLVEYRVDRLLASEHGEQDEQGLAIIQGLVRASPLPCIITCRGAAEGGEFEGEDSARLWMYERLTPRQGSGPEEGVPAYIDLEFSSLARTPLTPGLADAGASSTRLILSFHDHEGRPSSLLRTIAQMRANPRAGVIKVAWRARSIRDTLEAFEILRDADRPTIALCMGEFGLASRVLAPKFGALLTFAALRAEAATAPGQPTIRDLIDLYRFRSIGARTRLYGVVGWPVGHSRSPAVHNAGFEAAGHDGVYLPLPVPAEWEHFKATIGALLDDRALGLGGLSVTMPHKEHLVRLAQSDGTRAWTLDDVSARCQAANTLVVREDGSCHVLNTDASGAAAVVREVLTRMDLRGARVWVIGAGGVGRGVAAGLALAGAHVLVSARSDERAFAMAQRLREAGVAPGRVEAHAMAGALPEACEALVNCTPVGMLGGPDAYGTPIEMALFDRLPQEVAIIDTVYAPPETPLLRAARARGMRTAGGVGMFVEQAALQSEAWTGVPASRVLFQRITLESVPPEPL